jgi:hypothetical protein
MAIFGLEQTGFSEGLQIYTAGSEAALITVNFSCFGILFIPSSCPAAASEVTLFH